MNWHSQQNQRRANARRLRWAAAFATAAASLARADGDALDEVVVSARKRVEKAQDVPISLTGISGEELQRSGEVRVQDILRTVPNVGVDMLSPRQASIAIRGLGRNPANDALESSVGVFLDGVYLGRPGMIVSDLVDLERFEVLRGPQGTLFGKNATAGVLNITTAAPTADPEAWFEVSAGNAELRELRGAASGPFGDSAFSCRVSGFATQREGFVRDTATDQWLGDLDRAGARAQLQWQGNASTLRLIADYGSHDETGPGFLLVDPNIARLDGSTRTSSLETRGARFGYSPEFDPAARHSDADAPQRVVTENGGAALLGDWDIGRYHLSSITGWRKFTFRPWNDGDYSALDVLPELGTNVYSRQFSEELRLASPASGRFQYLAGLQYFEQSVRSEVFAQYGSEASEYLYPGLPSAALDGFRVTTTADPGTHSYSAFGQVYWWPREDLEIAAGLRWTLEDKETSVRQSTSDTPFAGTASRVDAATLQARQRLGSFQSRFVSSDENFVSGSLSVTWHLDRELAVYLSAARGAKSGGVNAAVLPPGADLTVDPEIALGFEAGIKSRWLQERLQLNASVFDTRIEGYQASIRDRVVGASYLANAGEVRSTGAEMELAYQPMHGLTFSGTVGYNDARYEAFRNAACPPELDNQQSCDFTGKRVAGAPPLTLGAAAEYTTALASWPYSLRTQVEYSHADGYRAELSRSTWTGDRDLVDLHISLETADGRKSLTAWVLNAFDETWYSGMAVVGPGGTGVAIGLLGAPRTLGMTLRFRY